MLRAIERHSQGVTRQRCQVHFVCNILNHAAAREKAAVLAQRNTLTEAPTLMAAQSTRSNGRGARTEEPRAAALLDGHGEEILAAYRLPEPHRKRMRFTNTLEWVNQEIKRKTRRIRIFPNEQACVRLVSMLMMDVNQEWMARLYLRTEEPSTSTAEAKGKRPKPYSQEI